MKPENVTQKSWEAVDKYNRQIRIIAKLKADIEREEGELLVAVSELGEWLTPDDAKPGEQFQMWVGDGIIQAEVIDKGRRLFNISWRKEMVRSGS